MENSHEFEGEEIKEIPSWERWITRITLFSGYASGFVIFVLMIVITVGVFFRRVLQQPLIFGEEYSAYLMAFCVYLGTAYALQQDAHIRVDVVTIRLKQKLRLYLRAITSFLSIIYGVVLTWKTISLVIYYKEIGHKAMSVLETPTWIPLILVPVGLSILTMQMVLCTVQDVKNVQQMRSSKKSKSA